MKDDTISRQAAIEAVGMNTWAGSRLKDLPSARPESRWIPVTERLPEFGERVLVTIPLIDGSTWARIAWYGTPMFENNVYFYESDSEWGDYEISGVTAWMPLPKPYERSEE